MRYISIFFLLSTLIYAQTQENNAKKVKDFKLENLDLKNIDKENQKTITDWKLGKIKFNAYKTNYLLYSHLNNIPSGNPDDNRHFKNSEIKFQFSVRGDILIDWIDNYDFLATGAYTQISNWQQFVDSSPFRDTNYEPEAFLTFPINKNLYFEDLKFKNIYFGYKHSSNGMAQTLNDQNQIDRELSQSRSWNRSYLSAEIEYKNLFLKTTYWERLAEIKDEDDNPDIMDYYGWGEIELNYIESDLIATLNLRKNIKENIRGTGGVKLSMTYPLVKSKKLMLYTEMFHGYGYSLIDYERKLTQFGIGVAVSR